MWKTAFTVLSFRPNLVYLTLTSKGVGFYKDALVAIIAKVLGAKMVYHFHNKGVSTRQDKWLDNLLYKIVFKNTDVILLSEHLYPDIQKYVPKNRVHICPNGIPEQGTVTERPRGAGDKPVRLLFLSNLIESKGVFVLLEACKILKEKGLAFQCTYVGGEGDVSSNELNKKISDLGLKEEVTYVGKKYNEEKEEVFAASDVFILPTYYPNECFSLVLLEAMQAGLPIVTTDEGGIPDMVEEGENGFLVPQKDANALAERLDELIENPQKRIKMGENGYEKYQRLFTLQAFEERFTDILKKISAHK